MRKIDGAGHVNNTFVDKDLVKGTPGTRLNAPWLNSVQDEICNAIKDHGDMNPDPSDTRQLSKSMSYVKNNVSQTIFYGDHPPTDVARLEWHNTQTNERFSKIDGTWVQSSLKISTDPDRFNYVNIITSPETLSVNSLINILTVDGDYYLPPADAVEAGQMIQVRIPHKHHDITPNFIGSDSNTIDTAEGKSNSYLWRFGLADIIFVSNGQDSWSLY